MYESPKSLEVICLDAICDNVLYYAEPHFILKHHDKWDVVFHSEEGNGSSDSNDSRCQSLKRIYRFSDADLFLIKEISEKLLDKFVEKNILCDATLSMFTEKNTKLQRVKLKNCKVTDVGLSILREHKITDLECVGLKKVSIGSIFDLLNPWTVENAVSCNFSRCTFIDSLGHNFTVKLTNLKNLRSLNLSYTELNLTGLRMLCEDLRFLQKLDISATAVDNLSALLLIKDQLTSLSIGDLLSSKKLVDTVVQLQYLRHLDVSLFNEKVDSNFGAEGEMYPVDQLLEYKESLPNLVSLDLSGWKDYVSRDLLLKYLEHHPKLRFLGIVLNDITFEPVFSDQTRPDYPGHLIIAGLGNEDQIKVTLKKYCERANYVQKALYHLFQLSNTFQEARPDMFELVLPAMAAHPTKFGVQMAATACLYNLTRGDLSKHIHPRALSQGVFLTLNAMSYFTEEFQLQKNSLLTLCSDRILQEVNFERFRCAKLVLDALCAFEDVNMNRMAVAICSILAAKVSTEETSELGTRPAYMQRLLTMVQSRVNSKIPDITLKFTLSALWNLTDESAATCKVFLEQGGAHLFLNVLKTFRDDSAIETKVLGLLNNIAEVGCLRQRLMLDSLVDELFSLLKSDNIDVSYFAAGIVAHLASDGQRMWSATHSRDEMLAELEHAVSHWKVPDSEMVAYRSFRPFFPLLKVDMDYQVQLWAVWAIHHVCTKNPKRYCFMLHEENGHLLLADLVNFADSHPEIKNISTQVLDTLDSNVKI